MKDLTQEKLKTIMRYNPDTGDFTWLQGLQSRKRNGVAGSPTSTGYVRIQLGRKRYKAHRLAWFWVHGEWPADEIDHINGIRDDNRLANLRAVSIKENARNKSMRSDNTSGIVGVGWDKQKRKWQSKIQPDGKTVHLGYFECKATAGYVAKHFRAKHGYHKNHGRKKISKNLSNKLDDLTNTQT